MQLIGLKMSYRYIDIYISIYVPVAHTCVNIHIYSPFAFIL